MVYEDNNVKLLTKIFTTFSKSSVCAVAIVDGGNNNLECIESCTDRLHIISMLATAIVNLTNQINAEETQLNNSCPNKDEQGN